MAFLVSTDYDSAIKAQHLLQVTENSTVVLADAELKAQEQIESYLNQYYDVGAIFSKSGVARNPLIVMYMVDITLYHVHARISSQIVPQIRQDRYDIALLWLDKVAGKKITPNLPIKQDDQGDDTSAIIFGSNEKLNHEW